MKAILLCTGLLLAGATTQLYAQKEVEHHWGSPGYDGAFATAATRDGGYVISGLTQSKGDTLGDIIVIKVNSSGDTLWTLQYGGPFIEGGNDVMETADGGIMVSGHTEDFGAQDCDAFLMKLDKDGRHEWMKVYGGAKDDISEGVRELPNGDFIMAGITASYGNPAPSELRHSWFVRTNGQGEMIWAKCYGGSGQDYGYSITPTTAGGFLAVGYTASRGQGEQDAWLLRMQDNGDTLWTRLYQDGGDSRFFKIIPTLDGNFVMAGYTQHAPGGTSLGLVVKIDPNGNELWRKTYGAETDNVQLHGVAQLPNGYLMFSGVNHKQDQSGNAYLMTTDENGVITSEQLFGGIRSYANAIAVQGNNTYLAAGYSSKWGDPAGDLFYMESSNTSVPLPPANTDQCFLFPNPVKGKSSVILPSAYAYQQVRLDIVDLSGRLVSSRDDMLGKDLVVDRKKLPGGQYIFKISCKDGKIFKGKFTIE